MKTIARTATKKIDAIFAAAVSVQGLSFDDASGRRPVPAAHVRSLVLSGGASLHQRGNGHYRATERGGRGFYDILMSDPVGEGVVKA